MGLKVFNGSYNIISSISASLTKAPEAVTVLPNSILLQSTSTMFVNRTSLISIFLQDLGVAWQPNTTYTFTVNSGFFKDYGGNLNPAFNATFTTPANGPVYQSISVPSNDYINITYDKPVQAGPGSLSLYTQTGTLVRSGIISTKQNGNIASFPVKGLLTASNSYYITASAGLVEDAYFGLSTAITGTSINFTVVSEPTFHGISANLTSTSTVLATVEKYHGYVNCSVHTSLYCNGGKRQAAIVNLASTSTFFAVPNMLIFQVHIPTNNFTCTFSCYSNFATKYVDWGDGTKTSHAYNTADPSHTYATAGYYQIVLDTQSKTIQNITFPKNPAITNTYGAVGIVTRLYSWGFWDPENAGNNSFALLQNHMELVQVPDTMLIGPNSNWYSTMFRNCTSLNDSRITKWFQRRGTSTTATSSLTYGSGYWPGSALMDGTFKTDTINFGDEDYGPASFSIDFWINAHTAATNDSTERIIFTTDNTGAGVLKITIQNSILKVYGGSSTILGGPVPVNQDCHISIYFDNSSYSNNYRYILWIDQIRYIGPQYGGQITPSNSVCTINAVQNIYSLDEFRIQLFNIDFGNLPPYINISTMSAPVQTSPYTSNKYTMLLLHFDGNITDSSNYDGLIYGETTMISMFENCTSLNQDLSSWNVQSVLGSQASNFASGTTSWNLPKPTFS